MKNINTSSNGIGILGVLGCIFVTLKLLNIINWSWWYVTMPFWGGLVLSLIILILVVIFSFVIAMIKK